jgi:hypothetical protein
MVTRCVFFEVGSGFSGCYDIRLKVLAALPRLFMKENQVAVEAKRDKTTRIVTLCLDPTFPNLLTIAAFCFYGAGVAQAVLCLTTDRTTGVRSPTEAEDFSSSLCVQTGSGSHPATCPMGTGGKARPGRDADHSPPSSAEVKNDQELYLLSPHVPPGRVTGSL